MPDPRDYRRAGWPPPQRGRVPGWYRATVGLLMLLVVLGFASVFALMIVK